MSSAEPIGCDNPREELKRLFRAGVEAAAPRRLIARALGGETAEASGIAAMVEAARAIYLIAAGKAALQMAAETEARCGARLKAGVAIAPAAAGAHEPGLANGSHVELIRAAHPVPDRSSVYAAEAALKVAARAGRGDLVIVALSGGASALMVKPAAGISLEDQIAINRALLLAGASIGELNTVRRHLSAIKGGGLLRAIPDARVVGLILSDVIGNDLAAIGSGPSAADPASYADAIAALKRHRLWGRAPERVRSHLERGAAGQIGETLKPGDPALSRVRNIIIGDNSVAAEAVSAAAAARGWTVERLPEIAGEAEKAGRAIAVRLCAARRGGPRLCAIAGGEAVVTVHGSGRGGRAQQSALAMGIELARLGAGRRINALFAGTDGIDGPTDAAGAFADPATVERGRAAQRDAAAALAANDAYSFFEATGDLLITGPTGTNVADLFIALVED